VESGRSAVSDRHSLSQRMEAREPSCAASAH
jgi:hypothetical protein